MFILSKKTLILMTLLCVSIPSIKVGAKFESTEYGTTAGVILAQERILQEAQATVTESQTEVVKECEPQWIEMGVPSNNSFKSYMDKNCLTNISSAQYALKSEYLDSASGIMMVDDRYVVAVGTYYATKVGTRIDLVMQNESVVPCIVGDIKADCDTDALNQQHTIDGSVVEFIVDTNRLVSEAKQRGDTSYADPNLMGEIASIRVYLEN